MKQDYIKALETQEKGIKAIQLDHLLLAMEQELGYIDFPQEVEEDVR